MVVTLRAVETTPPPDAELLGIDVMLDSYSGTPEAFAPLAK